MRLKIITKQKCTCEYIIMGTYIAGRKCPNGCGGVLVMQQCKGHSGYPVTHFWRHHEDKVFFLGKGYHDHPRPELKLSSEKRKSYIRVGGLFLCCVAETSEICSNEGEFLAVIEKFALVLHGKWSFMVYHQ